jgi:two-component system chemotaxis sensor kinase CheA
LEGNPADETLLAQIFRHFHTIKSSEVALSTQLSTPDSASPTTEPTHESPIEPTHATDIKVDQPVANANSTQDNTDVPTISTSFVRVDVKQLNKLMDLVGELVLTRNQILQLTADQEHTQLVGASQRLNLITSELQEEIMKTRMQPIKKLWDKFPRLVRDLSFTCGKQVNLKMEGEETELDKTLIETINDPLTHLIRNAIDHGIETPEKRLAQGKSQIGQLLIQAFHESGKVNIEITDDGAGFNPEHIKNRALQQGFITTEQADLVTNKELFEMVFLPGLSTARQVSDISGRGVGLDVVKTNIDKIGGSIEVHSVPSKGTTFRFKLPLTLAIIPALIIKSCGDGYAIPQVNLVELVRLKGEQLQNSIEWIHNAPVYRLRGKLLPLVYLNKELKLDDEVNNHQETINIVVLHAENRQFGLVVDEIKDTQEIVVKPLGKQLKKLNLYAGATILGDGYVALILDIMALGQRAFIMTSGNRTIQSKTEITTLEQEISRHNLERDQPMAATSNQEMLLILQATNQERVAIPLSSVTRLEQFHRSNLESAGGQLVIQYRGQILPLVDISEFIDKSSHCTSTSETIQVVVHATQGRQIGFIVPRILDIVEETITVKDAAHRKGVLYSTIIQGKVTELLDVENLQQTYPTFHHVAPS